MLSLSFSSNSPSLIIRLMLVVMVGKVRLSLLDISVRDMGPNLYMVSLMALWLETLILGRLFPIFEAIRFSYRQLSMQKPIAFK